VRSSVWVFGVISLSAVMLACGSKPPGVGHLGGPGDGNNAGASGASGEGGEGGSSSGGSDGQGATAGATGFFPDGPDAGSVVCRTVSTCDALECGPIADGCGNFIQCGGCDAPATCGGAGVASHCGVPGSGGGGGGGGTCVPETCESLGVTCGIHSNGCGETVTCSTCTGVGEECVLGQCQETASCTPLTCDDYPEPGRCGSVSDGCSGTIGCGFPSCPIGQACGAQEPGFCGDVVCTPLTCEQALADKPAGYCGFVSNGCDGELVGCATVCGNGETCGVLGDGGAFVQVCGTGGGSCSASDFATACAGKCGVISDGCTGTHNCGNPCALGEVCSANGVANVCGVPACVPNTCEGLNAECGVIDDGCGGTVTCADCVEPGETCAGGGTAYQCGSAQCQPRDQATACSLANANCGQQSDGCGGLAPSCGTCTGGETCGGGGTPNQCGAPTPPPCVPDGESCAELGWECGYAVNNCGDVFDCSEEGLSCNPFESCTGGIDSPTVCEGSVVDCDVCDDVPSCSVSSPTQLSGRVITPGRADNNAANQVGVPNAFVYILRTNDESALPTLGSGIPSGGTSCDRCDAQDLGPILTSAVTDSSGNFTLSGNIPVNQDFLLVTKVGKFRRAEIYNLPANAACTETVLPATLPGNPTRLPRTMTDGIAVNIPAMAISTGRIDAMECVFEKMGIASSQFSRPQLTGRIKLFRSDGAWPDQQSANCNACGTGSGNTDTTCRTNNCGGGSTQTRTNYLNAIKDSNLPASVASLSTYDMVVFDCEGQGYDSNFSQRDANGAKVREYVNRGGRMFASHLSMTWLNGNGSTTYTAGTALSTGLNMAATWDTNITATSNLNTSGTGVVSIVGDRPRASPRIQKFADWMVSEGVTSSPGYTFNITDPRSLANVDSLGASTEEFVYRSDGNHRVQQFSFNTPYGAPADDACGRVAYSGFHVAATGGGTNPFQNSVFPNHCAGNLTSQEKILLFMLFDLGGCVGDEPEAPTCDPLTECPEDVNCGTIADGCGGLLQCGQCTAPDICGGGGTPNQCGSSCTLTTCAAAGATCGSIADGCGGVLNCGTCTQGTCGGGGTANVCGTPACTPRTCASFGATCGSIGDGCGRTLNCGTCDSPAFCGGGGPNTCGTNACTPTDCGTANCGTVGDGCGNAITCGTCPQGSVCGAGGPNKCGPVCTPRTCAQAGNKNCGFIGDGCGGVLDCGECAEGLVCGGGNPGVSNVCGGDCDATTCALANAECGTVSDGCGGVLNCGTCPSGEVCGAGGLANQCGTGSCSPTTCGARCGIQSNGCSGTLNCGPCNGCVPFQCQTAVDCGPVADGCGALIDCGGCTNGNTCGGGGQASKCGGGIQ